MYIKRKDNEQLAEILEIELDHLKSMSRKYYCIWLFRHIWLYADVTTNIQDRCIDILHELIHSNCKYFGGIDYMLLNHNSIFSPWIQKYHIEYLRQSRWCK